MPSYFCKKKFRPPGSAQLIELNKLEEDENISTPMAAQQFKQRHDQLGVYKRLFELGWLYSDDQAQFYHFLIMDHHNLVDLLFAVNQLQDMFKKGLPSWFKHDFLQLIFMATAPRPLMLVAHKLYENQYLQDPTQLKTYLKPLMGYDDVTSMSLTVQSIIEKESQVAIIHQPVAVQANRRPRSKTLYNLSDLIPETDEMTPMFK